MKITTSILIVAALGLSSCASTQVDPADLNLVSPKGYSDFVPQDPLPSPRVTYLDGTTGQSVTKAWTQLSNAEIQNILTDTHAQITVGKFDANGSLTYMVAKATGSVGTYRVIMDYCEYVSEDVNDSASGKKIGQGRVGVGIRLTADITTSQADINLGSLLALGIAASANKVSGTMSVDSIGIRPAANPGPILTNATIDETSIQKTLEAVAIFQSKIAEPTTKLDPQLLAVKPSAADIPPASVAAKLL